MRVTAYAILSSFAAVHASLSSAHTMSAVIGSSYAPNLTSVSIVTDASTPTVLPGEVLIKVEGSSVNPIDYKVLDGRYSKVFPLRFPQTLGCDVVGTVVRSESDRFQSGDRVWADLGQGVTEGAWATYAVGPAAHFGKLGLPETHPLHKSLPAVATIPLVAKTMYQAFEYATTLRNATVLVTSVSGGTGTIGVQIAKALGAAKVITTAGSDETIALIKKLGADVVFDYHTVPNVYSALPADSVDVVVDNFGYNATEALGVLRSGESFISLMHQLPNITKPEVNAYAMVCNASRFDDLDHIASMLKRGDIKPVVDKTFTLDNAIPAMRAVMGVRTVGKVALSPFS